MEKEKRQRRSWFERIRRLFTSEPTTNKQKPGKPPEKQKGRSRRWLPGKLRTHQASTSFALPAPAEAAADHKVRQQAQAEDEQSKHAMVVALATAAAAEAAVAAAHAAAEVVRLTGTQQQQQPSRHERAAVVIQSAYRGYLARRALRALKGLVRLQALIRGQAVRRQTAATLRGLESLMKIQARHRCVGRPVHPYDDDDDLLFLMRRGGGGGGRDMHVAGAAVYNEDDQQYQYQQVGGGGGKGGWDSSIFSKEEMSAMMRSREEAALKRVRALQYASIQNEKLGIRRPPTSRYDETDQRWSWLEEWVGFGSHHHQPQPYDKDVPVAHQSPYREEYATDRLLSCSARRSFVRPSRRTPARGGGDAGYFYDDSAAAAFPGYMASTASAKAKFRSMSTPKERSSGSGDACSEHCFPFADRTMLSPIPSMSPIPSIASDMGFARWSARPPVAQRSPRVVKGGSMTPARSRSRRSPSHHSFGSEAALHQLQMEKYTPVR